MSHEELEKLVNAICVSTSGWNTEREHKQLVEDWYLVRRHARKLHLEAELAELNKSNEVVQ